LENFGAGFAISFKDSDQSDLCASGFSGKYIGIVIHHHFTNVPRRAYPIFMINTVLRPTIYDVFPK